MLNLELDPQMESRLQEIARNEHQTPEQIVRQVLVQYLSAKQSPDLLVNVANALPAVEAFLTKDPLFIQQEMRDEWH